MRIHFFTAPILRLRRAPFFKGLHNSHVKTLTLHKVSSPVSSFRAQREIFLAQRSNGERQMRSSRSTHAILSLPHKYRVPLRHKRSLGYARDDDTRERAISHSLSFLHVEGCPCGADLSSAFGAPLLQGATPLACKSATPKRHSLPDGKVNEMRIPLPLYRHFERSEKSSLHTGKRESVR